MSWGGGSNGIVPTIAQAEEVPRKPRQSRAKQPPAATGAVCALHPDAKRTRKGGCSKCAQLEYNRKWMERRKGGNAPAPPPEPARTARSKPNGKADIGGSVYSRNIKCPKCGITGRMRRPKDSGPDDMWICLATFCELRVGNYNIPVDRDYVLPAIDIPAKAAVAGAEV